MSIGVTFRVLVSLRSGKISPQLLFLVVKGIYLGIPSDETGQTEGPSHRRCDVIDIPPNSKVVGTDHRPIFYSLSMTTVTAPHE